MSEYDNLKAQKDDILRRQREELAKRIADACFGEATQEQIERVYHILESSR